MHPKQSATDRVSTLCLASLLTLLAACSGTASESAGSTESAASSAPPAKVAKLSEPTLTEYRSTWWGSSTGYPETLFGDELTAQVVTDSTGSRIAIHFRDVNGWLEIASREINTAFAPITGGTFHLDASDTYDNPLGSGRHKVSVSEWQFDGTVDGDVVTITSLRVDEVTTFYEAATWRNPTGKTAAVPERVWYTSTGACTGVLQ
ncbi:MAG TPA: hypothetical protein VM925_21045 [Labilithrix sp.]|nr:hypothetical protein [Labilithrix sp.]